MIWLAAKMAAERALAVVRSVPPLWLAIALCGAVAAFCWHGWRADHQRLVACQTARAADRAAYVTAQAEAVRIATEAKRATEARNEQARKDANDALETARRDGNARLAEWMRRQTAQGHSGGTDLPATGKAPAVDHGADPSAFVVEAADLSICTENTVRLQNAKAWAEALK
jgi:hypothetical protein